MARETIEMETDAFDPVRKTVALDPKVVWKNVGSTSHVIDSVRFHDEADDWQFRTQTIRPGDGAVHHFGSEGIYEYYCGLEGREMCGAILVGDVSLSEPLRCEEPRNE